MYKVETVLILMMCAMLAGCGMAFQVTHQQQKEGAPLPLSVPLDGIPFYTKAVACKHETVWLEQTFKVTLAAIPKLGDGEIVSKEIPREVYSSTTFKEFIKQVHKKEPNKDFKNILDQFKGFREYTPPLGSSPLPIDKLILAYNQIEPFTFIDYTDPHYYNAKIPLVGSVNADVNLSPELTLSKVSANVQEQTLKTFLDLLPVKEVLTNVAKAAIGIKAAEEVEIRLTIEPQVYKYTLSMLGGKVNKLPCGNPTELLKNPSTGSFSRTLMSVDESKKKEDESKKVK